MAIHLNSRRNKLILLGLVALCGIALEAYLFSPAGPFMRMGNLDLNFLLAPLAVFLVLFVISAMVPLVLVNRYTLLISTVIQYTGLAIFTFLILDRALLFARLPFLSSSLDVLNLLADSAVYPGLFWVGMGFYTISNLIIPNKRNRHIHRPLFAMLGYLVIGLAFWKLLDIFSLYWTPLRGLGYVIGLSLIVIALTRLTGYFTSPMSLYLEKTLRWALEHPVKLFWYCVLVLCYFVFARPLIYAISEYAYLIEWVVICFAGYQILNWFKNILKVPLPRAFSADEWQKHRQINHFITDDDFDKMVVLQEEFIQTGHRRNLLLYLSELLKSNGIVETRISEILQPVIEYNDLKVRWYTLWILKKRLLQANRERRLRALEDMMKRLRSLIYPTAIFLDGAAHA